LHLFEEPKSDHGVWSGGETGVWDNSLTHSLQLRVAVWHIVPLQSTTGNTGVRNNSLTNQLRAEMICVWQNLLIRRLPERQDRSQA
jgi:hypothetical protein